jgi:hypothetical protein
MSYEVMSLVVPPVISLLGAKNSLLGCCREYLLLPL